MRIRRTAVLVASLMLVSMVAGADGPFNFYSVIPCRVLDTRSNGGPIPAGQTRNVAVGGTCGIPAGAKMAALSFAVLGPTTSGHITAYAFGTSQPGTATVNFSGGETAIDNGSVVSLTPNQTNGMTVYVAGSQINLIVDVTGYLQ